VATFRGNVPESRDVVWADSAHRLLAGNQVGLDAVERDEGGAGGGRPLPKRAGGGVDRTAGQG